MSTEVDQAWLNLSKEYDRYAVVKNMHRFDVLADTASRIRIGDGITVRNHLTYQKAAAHPFRASESVNSTAQVSGIVAGMWRSSSSMSVEIGSEARKISVGFNGQYGAFVEVDAAYQAAVNVLRNKTVYYFSAEYVDNSAPLDEPTLVWSELPDPESSATDETDRLRGFLETYGSHYVSDVKRGVQVIARFSVDGRTEETQRNLQSHINALYGLFAVGGSLGTDFANTLRSQNIETELLVRAATVEPSGAVFARNPEEVVSFLSRLRSGEIKITPGVIGCTLTSYRHTLSPAPKCKALLTPPGDLVPATRGFRVTVTPKYFQKKGDGNFPNLWLHPHELTLFGQGNESVHFNNVKLGGEVYSLKPEQNLVYYLPLDARSFDIDSRLSFNKFVVTDGPREFDTPVTGGFDPAQPHAEGDIGWGGVKGTWGITRIAVDVVSE